MYPTVHARQTNLLIVRADHLRRWRSDSAVGSILRQGRLDHPLLANLFTKQAEPNLPLCPASLLFCSLLLHSTSADILLYSAAWESLDRT